MNAAILDFFFVLNDLTNTTDATVHQQQRHSDYEPTLMT